MKMKDKGKVYPSPSSSSDSQTPDTLSLLLLQLLPATILSLAYSLSPQDREVLAYMITRTLKTTPTKSPNKPKKPNLTSHKPPLFDCGCFDCYTIFWFRWDSSPNRELIHQAIEAFEEHLANGEHSKRRGKKREKHSRRVSDTPVEVLSPEISVVSPEVSGDEAETAAETASAAEAAEVVVAEAVIMKSTAANNHKGLARKVLPDVMGLLTSRLWNLWSPNM